MMKFFNKVIENYKKRLALCTYVHYIYNWTLKKDEFCRDIKNREWLTIRHYIELIDHPEYREMICSVLVLNLMNMRLSDWLITWEWITLKQHWKWKYPVQHFHVLLKKHAKRWLNFSLKEKNYTFQEVIFIFAVMWSVVRIVGICSI